MFKQIDEDIYEENFGLLYGDFKEKCIIKHFPGRTITETDNMLISMLGMNVHPIHIDYEHSKGNEWGRPIVSSLVTVAIVGGLSLRGTSAQGLMNLGWKNIELPNPVFIGDTLYAQSKCINKRLSKSREHVGIVQMETIAKNQKNEVVIKWERTFMVRV